MLIILPFNHAIQFSPKPPWVLMNQISSMQNSLIRSIIYGFHGLDSTDAVDSMDSSLCRASFSRGIPRSLLHIQRDQVPNPSLITCKGEFLKEIGFESDIERAWRSDEKKKKHEREMRRRKKKEIELVACMRVIHTLSV